MQRVNQRHRRNLLLLIARNLLGRWVAPQQVESDQGGVQQPAERDAAEEERSDGRRARHAVDDVDRQRRGGGVARGGQKLPHGRRAGQAVRDDDGDEGAEVGEEVECKL